MKFFQVSLAICLVAALAQGAPVAEGTVDTFDPDYFLESLGIFKEMSPEEIFDRVTVVAEDIKEVLDVAGDIIETFDAAVASEYAEELQDAVGVVLEDLKSVTRDDFPDFARGVFLAIKQWMDSQLIAMGYGPTEPLWKKFAPDMDGNFEIALQTYINDLKDLSDEEFFQRVKADILDLEATADDAFTWLEGIDEDIADGFITGIKLGLDQYFTVTEGFTYSDWRNLVKNILKEIGPYLDWVLTGNFNLPEENISNKRIIWL